jgi:hypothetical protein
LEIAGELQEQAMTNLWDWTDDNDHALRQALRKITEPARRHKCELCHEVFVCHICSIDKWHSLHWESRTDYSLICEDCIEKNELWVAVVWQNAITEGYEKAGLGSDIAFYDHITGEIIGHGTLRISRNAMSDEGRAIMAQTLNENRYIKAKLDAAKVRAIRKSQKKYRELAQDYGVALSTIHSVKRFVNWKGVV